MKIIIIFIISFLSLCFFSNSKAQVYDILNLTEGERLNLSAIQETYNAKRRLPNEYYSNRDTLFFIYKVLGSEWYKAGIRFHEDGSKLLISCCVKEDGSIDVLVLNFDTRFSGQERSKMLLIAESVRSKFKFAPPPNTKFFFGTETYLTNP